MGRLVAGVDSSTQSTTVVIVDADTGRRVAVGRASHEVVGTGGARESDPEGWWRALGEALAATGRAREVAATSIAAQQHGLVVLDDGGRPLRPAILWNDTRSATEARALVDALGREGWADRIGTVPVPSITVTRWAWLRAHEPSLVGLVRAVRLPHDFLTERLTGEGVTDRGDASGTGWWSTATGTYDRAVLDLPAVGLDEDVLPRVLGPRERAGTVRESAAATLGLRPGIPVGPGTGDNMGAALGLGVPIGAPVLSLGTSGVVSAVSDRRSADPSGIVAGFADATGRFLPLACTLNCTLAVDRVCGWLGLDREDVAPSDGVVAIPWFDGERTPDLPHAEAAVLGLRHDTSPGAILAATYEGAVIGLLDAVDAIAASAGGIEQQAPLTLVGGGAKGRAWQDAIRRLSGRAVVVAAETEPVAMGAAVQAAAILTGEEPLSVAERWGAGSGQGLDPLERDDAVLERYRRVRDGVVSTVGALRATRGV